MGNDAAAKPSAVLTGTTAVGELMAEQTLLNLTPGTNDDPKTPPAMPSPILSDGPEPAETNPEQQLSPAHVATANDESKDEQLEDDSAKFTLFPEFPTEIRLQIFRAMFPGPRHVCLDADFHWTFNYEASVHSQNRLALPPTLFISQESRTETLKHYYVVFKHDSGAFKGYEPFAERPFVFNPTIDSAYITFGSLHGGTNYRRFDSWINYLNMQIPGCNNAIQSLEIRDMNWEAPITAWIQGESPMEGLTKWNKAGGLQWFHGLKELCFTQYRDADNGLRYRTETRWYQPQPARRYEEYATEVTDWFVKRSDKGVEGRIPHVTVRGFHKVKWTALNMEKS
jgi:hypothetical protein